MSLAKTEKQPYESYLIYGDFSEVMEDGETITSAVTSAVDKDGDDATATVIEAGSEIIGTGDDYAKLYVRIKGGVESDSPYKFTIRIVTSNSNKWEVDGQIVVKEK